MPENGWFLIEGFIEFVSLTCRVGLFGVSRINVRWGLMRDMVWCDEGVGMSK